MGVSGRGRGRAAARVVRDDDSYATTDDDAMDVSDETSQGTEMEVADDDDDETLTLRCYDVRISLLDGMPSIPTRGRVNQHNRSRGPKQFKKINQNN